MNFTVAKLQAMGKDFKSRKLKSLNKNLPGLGDKKAPIIVYADSTFSKEALRGYKELLSWGYKNVTILDGGLTEWKQKGFPLLNTPPESRIVYVKKLVPGEVASEEFENLVNTNKALVLDVRTPKRAVITPVNMTLKTLQSRMYHCPTRRCAEPNPARSSMKPKPKPINPARMRLTSIVIRPIFASGAAFISTSP